MENDNTGQEKRKQLFLGKKVLIRRKVGEQTFYYKGECLDISSTNVLIIDQRSGAMNFPLAECSIEVIQ